MLNKGGLESKKTSGRGRVLFLDIPIQRTYQVLTRGRIIFIGRKGAMLDELSRFSAENGLRQVADPSH
jgi:hypothetical protein